VGNLSLHQQLFYHTHSHSRARLLFGQQPSLASTMERRMTEGQVRKIEAHKERQRLVKKHRKRLHVLRNPSKLAFRGWEDEEEPWSLDTCKEYIEWCHIDKVFPEERHNVHRHSWAANLKHCLCPEFKQRCIEVWQFLYKNQRWLEMRLRYTWQEWCMRRLNFGSGLIGQP